MRLGYAYAGISPALFSSAAAIPDAPADPSYSTVPTASTYADSPVSGWRVPHDAATLLDRGLSGGFNTAGDGVLALDDNTDTTHARDQLLKCATSGGAGNAFVAERLWYMPDKVNYTENVYTSMSGGWHQLDLLPVAGECLIWRGLDATTQELSIGIADAGSGYFYYTVNGAVEGAARPYDRLQSVRWSWAANGDVVLQSRISGTWRTEYDGNVGAIAAIDRFEWGTMGATKATDIRFSAMLLDDEEFFADDFDYLLTVSGTKYSNQSAAAIGLMVRDGMFNATQARIRWATGSDPSGGSASTWNAFTNRDQNMLMFELESLTSGIAYSYQFEIGNALGTVVYTSPPYLFRTKAATGTSAACKWGAGSCWQHTPVAHPYREEDHIIDNVDADYIGFRNLGDAGYEASNIGSVHAYWEQNPPETVEEFQQMSREFYNDKRIRKLQQLGVYQEAPDDHQIINGADARMAPGGTRYNNLASTFSDRLTDNYGVSTTLGDLWDAGTAVQIAWNARFILDAPTSGVFYHVQYHGKYAFIQLDTRLHRNPALETYIGAAQWTWLQSTIDNLPASIEMVYILGQTAFANYTSKNGEGWPSVQSDGSDEYDAFKAYCRANIDCNYVFVTGDDHIGYAFHRKMAATAEPEQPARELGELRASGVAARVHLHDIDESLWYANHTGYSNSPADMIRCSSILLDGDADAANLTLSAYHNGQVNSYDALTADVTAPVLSSPADTANGSAAGTLSVSTNEANGTLYWVVTGSATAPSAAQIVAGNDHTGSAAADSGSQTVTATGTQNIAASGLTAETTYYAHFVHVDAGTNISNVVSGDGFTTAAADVTAPTLSSPADAANGSTAMTGSVSTDEANGTLYWYISISATPPSGADLKAGTGAVAAGSQTVTATGTQNISDNGLTAETQYYTHFLHRDAAGNDSAIASADGFTTEGASILATMTHSWDSTAGVSDTAGSITSWAAAVGGATASPGVSPSTGATSPNGAALVDFTGTAYMRASFTAIPRPFYIACYFQVDSNSGTDYLFDGYEAGSERVALSAGGSAFSLYAGTNKTVSTHTPSTSPRIAVIVFPASSTDATFYLDGISSPVTVTGVGGDPMKGVTFAARNSGNDPADMKWGYWAIKSGTPDSTEINNVAQAIEAKFEVSAGDVWSAS